MAGCNVPRRVWVAITIGLILGILIQPLFGVQGVDAIRDTQTRYAGTNCVVIGKSFSGTDNMVAWGSAGESDGYQCTYYRLSGYYECFGGWNHTMYETWQPYGFGHQQLCGYPNVNISTHLHNGCEYAVCAGTFSSYVQESP